MTSPLLEWRPIDTAPKDGTVVLLSDGTDVRPAMWDDWSGLAKARWAFWIIGETELQPSYWMPLPDPPKAERVYEVTYWNPLPDPPKAEKAP